jgi:AbrB family looped-hinge helix DNA binding protein
MRVVKVTSKGQVTIPAEVRSELGIDEYTHLAVSVDGDAVRLRKLGVTRPLGNEDPIWDLIGAAASGRHDVSERHDEHLAEAEMRAWRESS